MGPHHEWGNGHTVFGTALSLDIPEAILQRPLKKEVWGQTHVTVLQEPIPFTLLPVEEEEEAGPGAGGGEGGPQGEGAAAAGKAAAASALGLGGAKLRVVGSGEAGDR